MDKEKLRYAILQEIDKGKEGLPADAKLFNVSEKDFFNQVTFLEREGYINEVLYLSNQVHSWPQNGLTAKGEEHLKGNSALSKWYKVAKEARSWFP